MAARAGWTNEELAGLIAAHRREQGDTSGKGACAESEAAGIALIVRAARDDWRAEAWRLERMFPERFGQRARVQMEHSGSSALTVVVPDDDQRSGEVAGILAQVGAVVVPAGTADANANGNGSPTRERGLG